MVYICMTVRYMVGLVCVSREKIYYSIVHLCMDGRVRYIVDLMCNKRVDEYVYM